jgi:hypothetical protein
MGDNKPCHTGTKHSIFTAVPTLTC